MKQCIEQLCQELVALPRHGFNHRWQIKRYQALMQDTHAVVNRWPITQCSQATTWITAHTLSTVWLKWCLITLIKTTLDSSRKKMTIFSDGCCSQNKSKIPFFYLSQLTGGPATEHCYFGSRHGKSLCDSLGGTTKTAARSTMKARQAVISSAAEMVEFCQRTLQQPVSTTTDGTCVHRKRWFVELKNIKVNSSATLKTVPGTRKIIAWG